MVYIKAHLFHKEPHLDEIFCDWVRRKFGQKKYPGSDAAEIIIKGAANHALGESVSNLKKRGIEVFGRWGGEFDEHSPLTPDKCSADLVVEDLGLKNHPAIDAILEFVRKTDLGPAFHQLDLSNLVKIMHAKNSNNPIMVIKWAQEALDAKYQELILNIDGMKIPSWKSAPDLIEELLKVPDGPALQNLIKFARTDNHSFGLSRITSAIKTIAQITQTNGLNKAMEWAKTALEAAYWDQVEFQKAQEIVREARQEVIECNNKIVKIFFACTENRKYSAAARFAGAAVIIQRQPSGNVQIYPNLNVKQLGFKVLMHKIAAAIRLAEQNCKGQVITTDEVKLETESMVLGAEEWYYTGSKGQFLLNGSTTAENVPTKLNDEVIIELVKKNIAII